ncbi:peptidase C14 [Paenibacillus sp. FSL H7-0326]|uniref:caspase family protein n=1 Tax=Paenibacillus sp. FSL H7-0326 TaxID=1921144 RepID=UPI00096CEA18|nr:caspase family protein [Paenibacillus sp. FSL H7-0326]OMC71387.1 peptidase C14 [Paenibacillus sp. FSL H7-0326]
MRKALVIGIDYYEKVSLLHGCVNDAYSVKQVLERHSDGTRNFAVAMIAATGESSPLSRKQLREGIVELFKDDSEVALLYYSGHGFIDNFGGYLVTSDCSDGDDGLSMNEILKIANDSPARNRIVVLDACHSGLLGDFDRSVNVATLKEGITILTSSSKDQYSVETNGSGVFTNLFVDALNGSAANLVGHITPGSVYAHIDQSLGPWQQRPIFKTNVKSFVALRKTQPPIALQELHEIIELFPDKGYQFPLDPSFEPDSDSPIKGNTQKFAILQKYNRINLLIPVDAPHMYHAAMESKACKLTVLGEHYWSLVKNELL